MPTALGLVNKPMLLGSNATFEKARARKFDLLPNMILFGSSCS